MSQKRRKKRENICKHIPVEMYARSYMNATVLLGMVLFIGTEKCDTQVHGFIHF